LIKSFLEGYSIDRNIKTLYTKLVLDSDLTDHKLGDDMRKDTCNLKLFLYSLNTLMVDDRKLLYQWRPFKEFMSYEYKEVTDKTIEQLFTKVAKHEAIHALVRLSGSGIKQIMSKVNKQMTKSETFEKLLNSHSKCTTNREGRKIFNVDPEYLTEYNSFYYSNIDELNEAVKNSEEFLKVHEKKINKSKVKDLDPLRTKSCALGFILDRSREQMLKSGVPKFLIGLLNNLKKLGIEDKDIEEYSVHLLKLLINHATDLKSIDKMDKSVDKMIDLLSDNIDFFNNIRSEGIYIPLSQAYTDFLDDGTEAVSPNIHEIEKKKEKKKMDRKKMIEKRKAQAMAKMSKQRSNLIGKYKEATKTTDSADERSLADEEDNKDLPKCQKCYEILSESEFPSKPYGYMATIVKTRLYNDSSRQTFNQQKVVDTNFMNSEGRKNIEKLKFYEDDLLMNQLLDKDN